MKVEVINNQSVIRLSKIRIKNIVKSVITFENRVCDEVAIHLVNTKKICELHQQFFNDPSTTDCISFPIDDFNDAYCHIGEVFVCPQTAVDYSKDHHADVYQEITLYIVHGLLHLMGYDDIQKKDRIKMRNAEKRHLANLKKLNITLN